MRYKRIVIKLGTNLLTGGTSYLSQEVMADIVRQIASLHKKKCEIVIVSSGAVAAGRQKLGLSHEKRKDIPFKQVLAAVGQNQLMYQYEQLFKKYEITVAQALLTKADITERAGYLNARNTLLALVDLGVICIINENDVVATDELSELRFGDNDNLSAMVANLIDADLLILLSDIDGLYTADPHHNSNAVRIARVEQITEEIEGLAGGVANSLGTGGMITKIEAAKLATASGVATVIANGRTSDVITQVVFGADIGTVFVPRNDKIDSRKRWILSGLCCKGSLGIDEGAASALQKKNKSLLPAGIKSIDGDFERGDVVDIIDQNGTLIGYGICNYGAADIRNIKGAHSKDIEHILGYGYGSEIIHRNNMVIV